MAARARSEAPRVRARSDAYVGLLVLALLAQIAGGVFLYLEWDSYGSTKPPPKVPDRPAVQVPQQPPGGQQQGGQQMGGQQMGGQQMGGMQMGGQQMGMQ